MINKHPAWCDQAEAKDKPDPDCRRAMTRAFDEGLQFLVKRDGADMSKWRWGAEHIALLKHKVFSHVPLLDRISDLSLPSNGGFYTLDRGGGFEVPADMPFARTHGGGFRGLYDLSELDKSRFMITTGKSGHILGPLRRSRAAMDRREVDRYCGDRGRVEGQGGEGAARLRE